MSRFFSNPIEWVHFFCSVVLLVSALGCFFSHYSHSACRKIEDNSINVWLKWEMRRGNEGESDNRNNIKRNFVNPSITISRFVNVAIRWQCHVVFSKPLHINTHMSVYVGNIFFIHEFYLIWRHSFRIYFQPQSIFCSFIFSFFHSLFISAYFTMFPEMLLYFKMCNLFICFSSKKPFPYSLMRLSFMPFIYWISMTIKGFQCVDYTHIFFK